MTISKLIIAIIVLLGGLYTAINVYIGGEPSPLVAVLTAANAVQYAVLE